MPANRNCSKALHPSGLPLPAATTTRPVVGAAHAAGDRPTLHQGPAATHIRQQPLGARWTEATTATKAATDGSKTERKPKSLLREL